MGKETRARRHNVIVQKRHRHEKILKLKTRLATAEPKARETILTKLKKLGALQTVVKK